MKNLFTLFFLFIFATNPVLSQDTIHVPADYTTIQAGIDASNNGDIVLVAEDTYYENINYNGKAITIASHFLIDGDTSHISNTIIDGSQPIYSDSASVVLFKSGEDSNSVLCGFTLKGGSGTLTNFPWVIWIKIGGGIYCLDASPTILNTIIKRNNNGGGYIDGGNAQPHLFKVSICNNDIGLFLSGGCTPRLENVDIAYNVAADIWSSYGGGIQCWGANPQLSNVNIHHNIAEYGGGIYLKNWNGYNSNPFFDPVNRCNIYLNLARIGGNDIAAETPTNYQIVVDTFTVLQPSEIHAYPLNQFSFDIQNEKIEQVQADLYINPVTGDDNNSGLTQNEPLKTITMGLHKIITTENDPRTIYLANGLYTPLTEFYFPLFLRSYFSIEGESRDGVMIDAEGFTSVFDIIVGRNNVALRNITLTGCSDLYGAAVYCYESELNMKNINVTNNQGMGVYVRNGSNINMDSCLINNNGGGGFSLWFSSEAVITNTIIESNEETALSIEYGGSSATIENVIIQNNNGVWLSCRNSNLIANDLFILKNKAYGNYHWGGFFISGSTASLTNVVISENEVQGKGGGIYIGESTVDLSKATINRNKATDKGGGMYIDPESEVELSEVTVSENIADFRGGGIYFYEGTEVNFDSVNRCNIYLNEGPYGSDLCAEFFNGIINIVVDTFTVLEPTSFYAYPLEKFTFDILHEYQPTDVEDEIALPVSYRIFQNYPNPFNPSTKIKYQIPELSFVTIKVYDVLGNELITLVKEEKPIGNFEIEFDATTLPSGIYFYRLRAGGFIDTRKMILLK